MTEMFEQILDKITGNGRKLCIMGSHPDLPDFEQLGFVMISRDDIGSHPDINHVIAFDHELLYSCPHPVPSSCYIFLCNADVEVGACSNHTLHWTKHNIFEYVEQPFISKQLPQQNKDYFRDELIRMIPELEKYREKTAIIYAGATQEYSPMYRDVRDIVSEIREQLYAGFRNIVFWCGDENLQPNGLYNSQSAVEQLVIDEPVSQDVEFFYVTSGIGAEKIYQDAYLKHKWTRKMHMIPVMRFEMITYPFTKDEDQQRTCDKNLWAALDIPYRPRSREKLYLNFNRVPRIHRSLFMSELQSRNLIEQGFNSYTLVEDNNPSTQNAQVHKFITFLHERTDKTLLPHFDSVVKQSPFVLNRTTDRDNPVELELDDLDYFRKSYLSIVSETVFFNSKLTPGEYFDTVFFSEKIYKPMMCKHPFILIGSPGSLKVLHEFGYQTFHPYIDETYDTITDDFERMTAIVDELERLSKLSDVEWVELQKNVAPTVEYNFSRLITRKSLCTRPGIENKFIY